MIDLTKYELIDICGSFRCWGRILGKVGNFTYVGGIATCNGLMEPVSPMQIGEEGYFDLPMMKDLASALISADITYGGAKESFFYEIAEQVLFWMIKSKKFNDKYLRELMEKARIPIDIAFKAVSIYRVPDICPCLKECTEEEEKAMITRLEKRRYEIQKYLDK